MGTVGYGQPVGAVVADSAVLARGQATGRLQGTAASRGGNVGRRGGHPLAGRQPAGACAR
ncbi:hypothetical protein BHM03_00008278, partial [Ensete ventricosum]